MNGITILLWITIAIIAIIAIIVVKLHYRGEELEKDEGSIIEDAGGLNKVFSAGQSILSGSNNESKSNNPTKLNQSKTTKPENKTHLFSGALEEPVSHDEPVTYDEPVAYEEPVVYEEPQISEVDHNNYKDIEYESQNQVLVNYGNTVEKFQEPMKQSQIDIMNQNNTPKNEKHELKDLFTIDELIKESKRKDNEREKEAHKNEEEDIELTQLKESIRQQKNEKNIEEIIDETPEETIQDIVNETESEEQTKENIQDIVNETKTESEEKTEENIQDIISKSSEESEEQQEAKTTDEIKDTPTEDQKIETPTVTSQDIEEAISTAAQDNKEEVKNISESKDITDVLLNEKDKDEKTEDVIKEPILKTPTKVKEDNKFATSSNDKNVLDEYENDLDYRKDLAKITNTIKGSKIFQGVKEKLKPEIEEENIVEHTDEQIEEDFIRNVNEYEDEYAPIINETHVDYEATYEDYHREDYEETLRQENTRNVFNMTETVPQRQETAKPTMDTIKEKPSRDNIKIKINNNEIVLKKGDEIIFNHQGETYSSQVYGIHGDDISVRYRRKNIVIKPSDVKKVY